MSQAQTVAQARAYLALVHTPNGALAALPPELRGDSAELGLGVHLQVGVVTRPKFRYFGPLAGNHEQAVGITLEFPLRPVRAGITVGYMFAECATGKRCSDVTLLGASVRGQLIRRELASPPTANVPLFGVAYDVALGYGRADTNVFSASASLPLYFSFHVRNPMWASESDPRFRPRTVIFISPGVAVGSRREGEESTSAAMAQLAGGITVQNIERGFGVTGSLRKFLVAETGLLFGFDLIWHLPR